MVFCPAHGREPLDWPMKKRILLVSCNGLGIGGVPRVMLNIVRELRGECDFDLLVFTKGPDFYDDVFQSMGCRIFRIPRKDRFFRWNVDMYLRGPRVFWGTLGILRKYGPYDVVHCHNYFESAYCLLAAKLAAIPIRIAHSHNDASYLPARLLLRVRNGLLRPIQNACATHRIGCSQAACDYLFGKGVPSSVIFNGIDLTLFQKARSSPGYKPGRKLRLLHVGNFGNQKNQLFLLEILRQLPGKTDFHLTMVGGGDSLYRQQVESKLQAYGLESYVSILPADTSVPEEMAKADLFVFPSRFEGFSLALLEAQASGLYCLASSNIPPDIDMGNIRFLPIQTPSVWAQAVADFASEKRERRFVDMRRCTVAAVTEEYRTLYQLPRCGNGESET